MSFLKSTLVIIATALSPAVHAEGADVVRDLQSLSPVTLDKAELQQLVPGAKMARVSGKGSNQTWTNDSDGTMVVHSDNRMFSAGRSSIASKWHISDDGRYCVLIPWKAVPTEEWCRFVIRTSAGYYMTRSVDTGNEKVYKFDVSK